MTHYDSLKKHLAEIETSLEEDMAPFALQVEPVSYTHLDVYKRQHFFCKADLSGACIEDCTGTTKE